MILHGSLKPSVDDGNVSTPGGQSLASMTTVTVGIVADVVDV
jgi:hypothetical protein